MTTAAFEPALWFAALPFVVFAATFTWLLSLPLRKVSIVDSIWSLMLFIAGVIYALGSDPRAPRFEIVLWPLTLWAARLALHVTRRNAGHGEDRRYQEMRERHQPGFAWKSLYRVFWLQALLAWVISLPLLGAFASNRPLGWLDHAGLALWGIGFLFEAVADWQLARFRRDPANQGRVLDRGLWRFTRHPNYFGECCVWWGFFLIALSAGAWWALPGPLLISFLLLRVTRQADIGKRRPAYADYVLKTNAFFPGRPRN